MGSDTEYRFSAVHVQMLHRRLGFRVKGLGFGVSALAASPQRTLLCTASGLHAHVSSAPNWVAVGGGGWERTGGREAYPSSSNLEYLSVAALNMSDRGASRRGGEEGGGGGGVACGELCEDALSCCFARISST